MKTTAQQKLWNSLCVWNVPCLDTHYSRTNRVRTICRDSVRLKSNNFPEQSTLIPSSVFEERMDVPTLPMPSLEVDVDLGFALFFLFLLCAFLLATMVRCAQMVLDPYSAISVSTYQEEQVE